jgi:hypothetical protein
MSCTHRFLGLHLENSLFPNWEVDHLFIGTFNPEWDRPNASNAEYFYGRSAYFWDAVTILFEDKTFDWNDDYKEDMVAFCKRNRIGFTDLIIAVEDADIQNESHRSKIYTVKDDDLETFSNIIWNTGNVIKYLHENRPEHIYFTLLSGNKTSIFTSEIEKIEQAAATLKISSKRLHSPTGANVGNGSPRLHQLIERWSENSTLPKIDLSKYPYINSVKSESKKQKPNTVSMSGVTILERYNLSVDETGKYSIFDVVEGRQLMVLPTLVDVIIPHIATTQGHSIDLLSQSGNRTPKNTRTLAKEVLQFFKQ